jgi:uncharacterized BrkB/YihY/UPF0761 family membrane protein
MTQETAAEKKKRTLRMEAQERVVGYITAAFGLVAGLAWNDAVRAFINHIYPDPGETILAKFMYALLLTIVLVIISIIFVHLRLKKD